MGIGTELTVASSVDAFFWEMVQATVRERGLQTGEAAEYYLVSLLGDFAKGRISDEPLSLRFAEAHQNEDPAVEMEVLKEVGDTSLYVAGFFGESLERKVVKADYYIAIGRSAYGSLARKLRRTVLSEVYEELADTFPIFVELLAGVRARVHLSTDPGKLYQKWQRTGEKALEGKLRSLGLVLPANDEEIASC